MDSELTQLRLESKRAKATKDSARRKEAERKLKDLEKELAQTIIMEARAIVRERFSYSVFLYEAEHVGITATGDEDLNELCRCPRQARPTSLLA
ncbi:hypothetical protein [Bradyrhizobium sp. USDA 4473]